MNNLKLTPEAKADLRLARRWYNKREEGLGKRFTTAIETKLETLVKAPLIHGQVHPQVRRAPVPVFPYSILYRVIGGTVQVVAVLHHKQNLQDILKARIDL